MTVKHAPTSGHVAFLTQSAVPCDHWLRQSAAQAGPACGSAQTRKRSQAAKQLSFGIGAAIGVFVFADEGTRHSSGCSVAWRNISRPVKAMTENINTAKITVRRKSSSGIGPMLALFSAGRQTETAKRTMVQRNGLSFGDKVAKSKSE
jgi:hypothetical protein